MPTAFEKRLIGTGGVPGQRGPTAKTILRSLSKKIDDKVGRKIIWAVNHICEDESITPKETIELLTPITHMLWGKPSQELDITSGGEKIMPSAPVIIKLPDNGTGRPVDGQ